MVRSNASCVMVTWDPPVNSQTDRRDKNITFQQFPWRAVTIGFPLFSFHKIPDFCEYETEKLGTLPNVIGLESV